MISASIHSDGNIIVLLPNMYCIFLLSLSIHPDGNNGLWSWSWCCALHYAWRAFHPKGDSVKNIIVSKFIQKLSKLPHQILPNGLSSASCIWIVYGPGSSIFMFKKTVLNKKYAFPPGGQEHHSFWTSQIDSNHGENRT